MNQSNNTHSNRNFLIFGVFFLLIGLFQVVLYRTGNDFYYQILSIAINVTGLLFTIFPPVISQFPSFKAIVNKIPRSVSIFIPLVLLLCLIFSLVVNFAFFSRSSTSTVSPPFKPSPTSTVVAFSTSTLTPTPTTSLPTPTPTLIPTATAIPTVPPTPTALPTDTPTTSEIPTITSISTIIPAQKQTITVKGHGFGTMEPYFNDNSQYIMFTDVTDHWNAGASGALLTLSVSSWTDNEIIITGFGDVYLNGYYILRKDDEVTISVYNAQTDAGPAMLNQVVTG